MTDVVFRRCRLVDPASGIDSVNDVTVTAGRIAAIGDKTPTPSKAEVIDAEGLVLMPGLVDIRVKSRHPAAAYKETPITLARAAVKGGITGIVVLPDTDSPLDDPESLKSQQQMLAGIDDPASRLRIHAYGAATRGAARGIARGIARGNEGDAMAELGLLAEAGAVGFTDADRAIADSLTMSRVLKYASMLKKPVIQHAEDTILADGGEMHEGEHSTRLGLRGIPAATEEIIIARDLTLLRLIGGRYHVAHLATARGVELIRNAKDEGLNVTCDTAPPYFMLNDLAVCDYDPRFRLSPPLRSEADRLAIVEGLAQGVIDAIASDHSPQDRDSKSLPFGQAACGYSGLETLLAATLSLYHGGALTLMRAVELLTFAPAECLGIAAGRIETGAPADLTLVDINRGWKIKGEAFASLSSSTPLEGAPVQGQVVGTWIDGVAVYHEKRNRTSAP